jgi:hypothetical protein
MDVSALRLADAADATTRRRIDAPTPAEAATDRPPERAPVDVAADWVPPSTLKFTVTAADVDARFEIHEATSVVTVTMYERATGEVLREFPSREILDVLASLTGPGLRVDLTS